jgi:hypothetical protein
MILKTFLRNYFITSFPDRDAASLHAAPVSAAASICSGEEAKNQFELKIVGSNPRQNINIWEILHRTAFTSGLYVFKFADRRKIKGLAHKALQK